MEDSAVVDVGVAPSVEGVAQAPKFEFDVPEIALVKSTETLTEICRDRVLFTHAPLLTHVRLTHDPLMAFIRETKLETPITKIQLPMPVFRGLAIRDANDNIVDDSWNKHLLAISKKDFVALFNFFACVGAVDYQQQLFVTTLTQTVPIVDVAAIYANVTLPTRSPVVLVLAIGLNTNLGQVFFEPPRVPGLFNPVKVIARATPETQIIEAAKHFFAEMPVPLAGATELTMKDAVELAKTGKVKNRPAIVSPLDLITEVPTDVPSSE